jgi:2'-5' RNA ligase
LRPHAPIRWSKVRNLHITTKFIGEWPEDRLEEVKSALSSVASRRPISIALHGFGWFPNPHRPRIFWIAVEGGQALRKLAADTEEALQGVGIPREAREYRPHLTLARIEESDVDLALLRRAVASLPERDWGEFVAENQHLYRSEISRSGSQYTKLASFCFETC